MCERRPGGERTPVRRPRRLRSRWHCDPADPTPGPRRPPPIWNRPLSRRRIGWLVVAARLRAVGVANLRLTRSSARRTCGQADHPHVICSAHRVREHQVGALFGNGDDHGIGVARNHRRHHRCVDHPQPAQPAQPAARSARSPLAPSVLAARSGLQQQHLVTASWVASIRIRPARSCRSSGWFRQPHARPAGWLR